MRSGARGLIQSPVLVGRDAFLALIDERLTGAAAGRGRLLFVAGEAVRPWGQTLRVMPPSTRMIAPVV